MQKVLILPCSVTIMALYQRPLPSLDSLDLALARLRGEVPFAPTEAVIISEETKQEIYI